MTPQSFATSTRQPTAAPPMIFDDPYSLERYCETLLAQRRRAVVDGYFFQYGNYFRTRQAPFYCTATLAQEEQSSAEVWLSCSAAKNGICEESYVRDFVVCDRLGSPLEEGQRATVTLEARLIPKLSQPECGLVVLDIIARRD